ncbi:MAG: DUF4260 domain-containing protein [Methylobacterium sp.]|nr:DUF4260 domain-containing protein [Methylobacterium sp.]
MSLLLRLEAFAVLVAALVAFVSIGGNWYVFAALFLAPDLAILVYFVSSRMGAMAYNIAHSYAVALPFGLMAFGMGWSLGIEIAVVWTGHIAFDRAAGYGLKYASGFKHTHLGRLG